MAKLQRITGKVFGETASAVGDADVGPYIGQFGSAKLGTYYGTTDVAEIQNLSAWSNGFIDAVTPSNQYPTLPEMTGALKVLSHQGCYILQQGIPEYDANTEYYTNGFCSYGNEIYVSLQDSNTGNQPNTSPTYWTKYSSRFLNYNQISNCILEAPNGVYSISNRNITFNSGLKILIPNGLNADRTLKNIELTLDSNVVKDCSTYTTGQTRVLFIDSNKNIYAITRQFCLGYFQYLSELPSTVDTSYAYYAFSRANNQWYGTSGSTTANWTPVNVYPLVTLYFASNTTMTALSTNYAVRLADTDMVDGRWRYSYSSLSTATAYDTYTINLADVLPNDNYWYECIFKFNISRTDTNSANSYYTATISGINIANGFVDGGSSSGDNKMDYGQYIGIVDGNRSMSIQLSGAASAPALNGHTTAMLAYRRIGTNA